MNMEMIKVDGVQLPCPSELVWGLQDVSSADSGRTQDATMHKNRVAQKRTLDITWNAPTWEIVCQVVQAVNPEYIQVEYPDPLTGNKHEVRTFYVGDRTSAFKTWWIGNQRMESLYFNLIER